MAPPADFLAVVGPTASGKTRLSIEVALALGGEIVSMDSRQVYRGMDVGTAKVSLADRGRVPHFGLDLRDPAQRYSAGQFGRDARGWILQIRERDRVPVLVGGTGFFLRVLQEPIFREPPLDPERKERLLRWLEGQPRQRLSRWLSALDPARVPVAEAGGPHRISRALLVALLSGRPLSWWHREGGAEGRPLQGRVFRVDVPREELDRRIDARVDRMLEEGLVEEVSRLLRAGFRTDDPAMTGTGYREIAGFLAGDGSLEDALDATKRRTRQYARRQMTWFRTQLREPAVAIDGLASLEVQLAAVLEGWQGGLSAGIDPRSAG